MIIRRKPSIARSSNNNCSYYPLRGHGSQIEGTYIPKVHFSYDELKFEEQIPSWLKNKIDILKTILWIPFNKIDLLYIQLLYMFVRGSTVIPPNSRILGLRK